MSLAEIDRLLAFRSTNKFINSKDEFQQVTKVSDSLLVKIAPYFKFPDWVVNQNNSNPRKQSFYKNNDISEAVTPSTTDINKATAADFKTINGIGVAFSERIIQYRSKLQGFTFDNQLYEVWGLDKIVADKVLSTFKIVDRPIIKKVNVNTVAFKDLLKNPYINYELCIKIFNYRDEVAELQDISELKNIKDFPLEKYERIVLYLFAN
jgi:DNA uptake protein ComE-like DNA-binding protein